MAVSSSQFLTHEQRLAKIGEILARGVANLLAEEDVEPQEQAPDRSSIILNEKEIEAFGLIRRFQGASPKEITERLGCSRSTASRTIQKWQEAGLVTSLGNTTSVRVQLTGAGLTMLKDFNLGP